MRFKPTSTIILCSVALFVAACAKTPPAKPSLSVPVAIIPNDSAAASIGSRASSVLGKAGISTTIGKDAHSQHFEIFVPLNQREQAEQLLKQDAQAQKYELKFVELRTKAAPQGYFPGSTPGLTPGLRE